MTKKIIIYFTANGNNNENEIKEEIIECKNEMVKQKKLCVECELQPSSNLIDTRVLKQLWLCGLALNTNIKGEIYFDIKEH